jgi:hypothetical protein
MKIGHQKFLQPFPTSNPVMCTFQAFFFVERIQEISRVQKFPLTLIPKPFDQSPDISLPHATDKLAGDGQ